MNWPKYNQMAAFWFHLAYLFLRVGAIIAGLAFGVWVGYKATPMQIDRLAALLTPVIAVLGAYIAFQQWRTARDKLSLDLFDRRYVIYSATQKLIKEVVQRGEASPETQREFLSDTRGAQWLFDGKVAAYLDELEHRMGELDSLYDYIHEGGNDDEYNQRLVNERSQHMYWFGEQLKDSETVFAPHMQLNG